jgi:hypothetical protein
MSGLKDSDKDEFWAVVEACLVEIHGLLKPSAEKKCKYIRYSVERNVNPDMLPNQLSDLFYHREPFDVSCDIAQKQLDINLYRTAYNRILSNHNW